MPFITPDYSTVREAILRDVANLLPEAAVTADSDYAVRANAVAAAIEGLYQYQQWIARQILPDTADADYLERWASLYGLARKAAVAATGSIAFSGAPGSAVPQGTQAKTLGGIAYVSTAPGTIGGGGTVSIAAQASVGGASGNQAAATALTLTAAPSGVLSAAAIVTMTGGVDAETDAALLARLLSRIRQPPHGGAAHDYVAWALEIAGVLGAYVYPSRRGLGTVDIVITTAGGLPSVQLIADVQAHINGLRPVTADCLVLGPTAIPVAVTASLTLSGVTLAAATAAINTALAAYFGALKPGDTVYRTRIAALISDTKGVVDFALAAPAANVATTVDSDQSELATVGTVTLT